MRLALLAVLLGLGSLAHAQDAELGVRYWYSSSTSTRSHNAQGPFPSLGNPTSVLTYEDVTAHALELHGRKSFAGDWFVKGYAGLGTITGGSLRDEDFRAGQVKEFDTTSTVKGNGLGYFSIDFGRDLWRFENGTAGFFVGYHYWRERLDAYGVLSILTSPPRVVQPESVPAITNDTTWQSLRVGLTSTARLSPASRLSAEVVIVPYAKMRDADSHWLRQDPNSEDFIAPAPNIHMQGEGYGFQFELELRHALQAAWELGAGLRYWFLRSESGTRSVPGLTVPIIEFESQRVGVTLSLTRRW